MSSAGDQGPQLMMQDCYSATVRMHQDIQCQGEESQQELELGAGASYMLQTNRQLFLYSVAMLG